MGIGLLVRAISGNDAHIVKFLCLRVVVPATSALTVLSRPAWAIRRNMPSSVRRLLLIVSIMALSTSIRAEERELTISCQSASVMPYEPILVHVALSNATDNDLLIPGDWEELLRVEAATDARLSSLQLRPWWRPQVIHPPAPPRALVRGAGVSTDLGFYPFDREGGLIFEQGKEYRLRVSLVLVEPAVTILSNEESVRVNEPSQEEILAIAEMKSRNNLRFAVLPEDMADGIVKEDIDDFVERYGETRLGKYVESTARLWRSGARPEERLKRLREDVEEKLRR